MFYNQQQNEFPSDDVFYYNCLSYGVSDPTLPSSLATFEETRTQPFLIKPQDYFMSIVRFSIDAASVPLFVCPVIENPFDAADLNFTPYRVTFLYGGIPYSANLSYIPNVNIPLPRAPLGTNQDLSGDYYFVYYYSIFIKMINIALVNAFNQVVLANPAFSGVPAPYVIYDTNTTKLSLVFPNVIIAGVNVFTVDYNYGVNNMPILDPQPAGKCYLFVNNLLYPYLESIEAFSMKSFFGQNSFLINVNDFNNNYYYPPQNAANAPATQTIVGFTNATDSYTVAPNWFIFTQQYAHVTAWNSVASIVFLTQMPIQPEYVPSFSLTSSNNTSAASSLPILTDFVPDITQPGEQRTRFNYVPTGPYRLIDIKATVPFNKIQFQIYWMDRFQNLYPLRISKQQMNSVKIMFIKKSYYKGLTK